MSPSVNKRRHNEDNEEEVESVTDFIPSAKDLDEIPELRRRRVLKRPYLRADIPPIHFLEEIFEDLIANALRLGFAKVLKQLGGRPLRVATVCSGTESPLLALEMVQKALGASHRFRFEHVFSCEIVPFKQAYIERNFRPPLLFLDILELSGDTARTAYGTPEAVPGDLDILVAGTACVDFSTLNNKQKTMEDIGESGATFKALLQYAAKCRPPIVILENIRGAPWDEACEYWTSIDYFAIHVIVDTKEYYIPQTRIRGYLLAMDNSHGGISGKDWGIISRRFKELMSKFKRPASSPAGMFLLSDDDRRLEQIRKDLSTRLEASTARAETAWERYQERHAAHRIENGVGEQRPISRSQGGGVTCQPPVFYWHEWFKAQVERIWETLDIKFLLGLQKEVDMSYKERWFDLSQGVDRGADVISSYGVAGCLTPSGMPFISTRGGPLSGLEALSLQGLPINRMILTRESQRELQDLAGNAMTSTVVCAAMLAALIAGYMALEPGHEQSEELASIEKPFVPVFRDHAILRLTDIEASHGFTSEADDDKARAEGYARYVAIVLKSARAARMCLCEKQSGVESNLVECVLCQHTACRSCSGNPPHPGQTLTIPRSSPLDFIAYLKSILPMRLALSGLFATDFIGFKSRFPTEGTWQTFIDTVNFALGHEMCFVDIKRTEFWTVLYAGRLSTLRLEIRYDRNGNRRDDLQWLFFVTPPRSSPAQCPLREILAKPIARMIPPRGSFFGGLWQISAPISTKFQLGISGFGNQAKSFSSECGLLDEDIANSLVWNSIIVTGQDADIEHLDVDVRGEYDFLPDCGTALGSMYRKKSAVENVVKSAKTVVSQVPAVFLFLDPHKYGSAESDAYVFSLEHNRNPGYAPRLTLAELSPLWRAQRLGATEEVVSAYYRSWTDAPSVTLKPASSEQIVYGCLEPGSRVLVGSTNCRDAYITLVSLSAPPPILNIPPVVTPWHALNPAISPELEDIVWAIQKIATLPASQNWNEIALTSELPVVGTCCHTCHPPAPSILWGRDKKGRVTPYEDPLGAAEYERALKSKPPAFLAFSQTGLDGRSEVRFALNVQTLAHQAYGMLVKTGTNEGVNLKWRLISNAYDLGRHLQSRFILLSNRGDAVHAQPPNFQLSLRLEQLRSLTWMVSQEAEEIKPFMEEETEEAFLPLMSWRAEVKVTLPKTIRGGLIADEVGYGKTAIILGLIDTQYKRDCERFTEAEHSEGCIPTKATLIIVPGNVFDQWASEIVKFLGNTYNILKISSVAKLGKTTFKAIQQADIVLISWAVLKSEAYYDTMRRFTGTPSTPSKAGRNFDDWFEEARRCLQELIKILKTEGPEAYLSDVRARRAQLRAKQRFSTYVPSRRLRGQAFSVQQKRTRQSKAEEKEDHQATPDRTEADRARSEDNNADAESQDSGYDTGTEVKDRKRFNIPREKATLQWEDLTYPLLQAFEFTRIVIDEYTYAGEERSISLLSLTGRSKWILSGTPALDEFADVKSIARHLGLHLGVDDDGDAPTQNSRLKQSRRNLTAVEAFQMFQPVRSEAWYQNRHIHAQNFLDRFARQNTAEIASIKMITHLVLSEQSSTERITYLELQNQLVLAKGRIRRLRNPTGDALISCLNDFMQSSQLAPEALLKCAITSRLTDYTWNGEKCSEQLMTKKKMRPLRLEKLGGLFRLQVFLESQWSKAAHEWRDFLGKVFSSDNAFGDNELADEAFDFCKRTIQTFDGWIEEDALKKSLKSQVEKRLKKARMLAALASQPYCTYEGAKKPELNEEAPSPRKRAKIKGKRAKKVSPTDPDHTPEMEKAMIEVILNEAVACVREFIQNERDIRFFQAMIETQSSDNITCQGCGDVIDDISSLTVLRSCGHILCSGCIMSSSTGQICAADGCGGSTILSKRVAANALDTSTRVIKSSKLNKMIEIIQNIPQDELVLLFVQFQDLMLIASHALTSVNIDHRMARQQNTKAILEFISSSVEKPKKAKTQLSRPKVLILHLGGAMAAGLNLQCANHVIFLAPLFVPSQHEYEAGMTQAIGRARRFGQTRDVHVYHMLSSETIDVNIFQSRNERKVVKRDGQPLLLCPEDLQNGDVLCEDRRFEV